MYLFSTFGNSGFEFCITAECFKLLTANSSPNEFTQKYKRMWPLRPLQFQVFELKCSLVNYSVVAVLNLAFHLDLTVGVPVSQNIVQVILLWPHITKLLFVLSQRPQFNSKSNNRSLIRAKQQEGHLTQLASPSFFRLSWQACQAKQLIIKRKARICLLIWITTADFGWK